VPWRNFYQMETKMKIPFFNCNVNSWLQSERAKVFYDFYLYWIQNEVHCLNQSRRAEDFLLYSTEYKDPDLELEVNKRMTPFDRRMQTTFKTTVIEVANRYHLMEEKRSGWNVPPLKIGAVFNNVDPRFYMGIFMMNKNGRWK